MKYVSTKTYRDLGSTVFRQWRAKHSHCSRPHGYGLSFYFEFEANELDHRNWVVDFGSLKTLEVYLKDHFDHTWLLASDDPEFDRIWTLSNFTKIVVVQATGCEAIADMVYQHVNEVILPHITGNRAWCRRVEVFENGKNSAMRVGHRPVDTVDRHKSDGDVYIVVSSPTYQDKFNLHKASPPPCDDCSTFDFSCTGVCKTR